MQSFQKLLLLLLFVGGCTSVGSFDCGGTCNKSIPFGEIGSCPKPGVPPDEHEGPCTGILTQACNVGLVCVDSTCLNCGHQGEPCCFASPGAQCVNGTCVSSSGDADICDTTCGQLGQKCCKNSNCDGAMCDDSTNQCVAFANINACSGALQSQVVPVIDSSTRCFRFDLTISPVSAAAAQTCIQDTLASTPGLEAATGPIGQFPFCVTAKPNNPGSVQTPSKITVFAQSAAEAVTCAQSGYDLTTETVEPIPDPNPTNICAGAL
jgi:hypothetical protein